MALLVTKLMQGRSDQELTPYLRAALQEIRDLIEQLPNESLARQREWRQLLRTG